MLRMMGYLLLISVWAQVNSSCSLADDKGDGEGIRVMILSNIDEGNIWIDSTYAKYMTGIEFSYINVDTALFSLDDLNGYDVVLLYEDGIFENSEATGDILHSYVMAGGNLVIGTFYWQDRSGGGYSGSWGGLEMIDPIYFGSCDYEYDSLGTVLNHELTRGVNSLKTYYRGGVDSLRGNAVALAWWSDGDVLIAYNRPNGTITALTTAPHEGYYWDSRESPDAPQGDFFKLWENAIRWTAAQGNGFSKNNVVPHENSIIRSSNINGMQKESGASLKAKATN